MKIPISHRIVNFARHLRQSKNVKASATLADFRTIPWHRLEIRGGQIFLAGHRELALNWPGRWFILRALALLDELITHEDLKVLKIHETRLDVRVAGVEYNLETWEDIYIVHEIFHCGDYDIRLGGECRVIDVGANIGVASLYFSSLSCVASIDSYELVPATAGRFRQNLALNPLLAAKINLHEHGLAEDDRTLEIDYYPELKGSMGIAGIAERAPQLSLEGRPMTKVKVTVKNAVDAFREVVERTPSLPVLAKIDCEGAEYEIFEALEGAGLLERVDAFVVEWHEFGPEAIRSRLQRAGHVVVLRSAARCHHGVLVSVRRNLDARAGVSFQ